MRIVWRWSVVAGASLLVAACGESSFPLPRDPGTVAVTVVDDGQLPVVGADVSVSATNERGGTFYIGTKTRTDGRTIVSGVPAGVQTVEVALPATHAAGSDSLKKSIEVLKGQSTNVRFTVKRRQP